MPAEQLTALIVLGGRSRCLLDRQKSSKHGNVGYKIPDLLPRQAHVWHYRVRVSQKVRQGGKIVIGLPGNFHKGFYVSTTGSLVRRHNVTGSAPALRNRSSISRISTNLRVCGGRNSQANAKHHSKNLSHRPLLRKPTLTQTKRVAACLPKSMGSSDVAPDQPSAAPKRRHCPVTVTHSGRSSDRA